MNFEKLNLSKETLDELKNANITEATSLQESILSSAANGKSLVINAKDESDKITAITIAAVEQLHQREGEKGTSVLLLTPQVQTAQSISDKIISLGVPENEVISAIDDGTMDSQAEGLATEPAIIVANPDRLQALLQEHRFIFRYINLVILDELDTIINDAHSDNLKRIKRRILSNYTTIIFSDQFDSGIKKVASSFADSPAVIGFGQSGSESATKTPPSISGHIKQGYINVPYRMKISTLMAHVSQASGNFVIFTASKRGTDRLYRVLKKRGLKATSLHGKLSDGKRDQRFSNFTNGNVQFLLVSDISASELNLTNVHQVINYDVPNDSDEYRFRAALLRTDGSPSIVSLVSKQDRSDISDLQNELGQTPNEIPLPDEVKEKLKKRKQNKSSNGQQKRGQQKKRKKNNEMELPRPSYDKLSGGRSGSHDEEKTGIVKFFKKLFSS